MGVNGIYYECYGNVHVKLRVVHYDWYPSLRICMSSSGEGDFAFSFDGVGDLRTFAGPPLLVDLRGALV